MGVNLRISGVKEGDLPVVKSDRMEVVGGARKVPPLTPAWALVKVVKN